MLAFCSAQPNWMPRKPKHMFQICQKVCGGRGPTTAISLPLLDEQDLPLVRAEGNGQVPRRAELAEALLREEVGDRPVGRRGPDGHALADRREAEVDGGD